MTGIEPARLWHKNLNLARLPISPHPQMIKPPGPLNLFLKEASICSYESENRWTVMNCWGTVRSVSNETGGLIPRGMMPGWWGNAGSCGSECTCHGNPSTQDFVLLTHLQMGPSVSVDDRTDY